MVAITGSTYEITQYLDQVSILDSDEIPKVTPTFSGSSNTAELMWTRFDVAVTGEAKMAAITGSTYVITQYPREAVS